MTASLGALHRDYDRISIPTIWVAFVASMLLHAVALMGWIPAPPRIVPFEEPKLGHQSNTLAIRLVPLTAPPVSTPPPPRVVPAPGPVARAAPSAPRVPSAPKARPTPPPAPVIAVEKPASPSSPIVVAPPSETKPAPAQDMGALLAARRRAREGAAAPDAAPTPSEPTETEQQRHNRIVAENLGLTSVPTFGNNPDRGGGVFQVRSLGYDIGEFAFFGWNKEINRNSLQVIEVRRGSNANMEIAMVRKMIAIIRERSGNDFLWQSRRLNRGVWLSARPADNAGLEEFILREFFADAPPARR